MAVLSKPADFLFLESNLQVMPRRVLAVVEKSFPSAPESETSTATTIESHVKLVQDSWWNLALNTSLNIFTMQRAIMVMGPGAVCMSCVPLVAPFNTPPVPYSSWVTNKRACAFQRSLFFLSVMQGAMSMLKFFSGNLIGGFFDGMIAGTGIYAASPDGVTMLSTYLVFAGFNGGMDLLQLIQMYQGMIPIYLLPLQPPAWRPMLLLLGCYYTYEFHKELTAVARGYACSGCQDSCFVQFMGHSIWGTQPGCEEHEQRRNERSTEPARVSTSSAPRDFGSGQIGLGSAGDGPAAPRRPNFAPFGGEGRRLGAEELAQAR